MLVGVHIDLIKSVANLGFGGIFFATQVPPGPRCTPVVISTKLASRRPLSCSVLRGPAPLRPPQPSGAPAGRLTALLPLDSLRRSRRSGHKQPSKKNGPDGSSKAPSPQKAFFEARDCDSCLRGRWPRDEITTCTAQRNAGRRQPPL
jgi:hypothetical protein